MILSIETSSEIGSVALAENRTVVWRSSFKGKRHFSSLFSCLEELSLSTSNIEKILIGIGPGSFSSIRVAIAAAQGLGIAKKAPLFSIPSVWSIGLQFAQVPSLGVFSDARRGELFCSLFSYGKLAKGPYLIAKNQLLETLQTLDLAVSPEDIHEKIIRAYPRAEDFFLLPDLCPPFNDIPFPEPIYLRGPI
ncbi:tRNA (adenosine(37)-N6)-threonylcarbamoyltransferase complex dimerization subunit type 1 TsaB [Methylacidiphilum caldifontis]|uniref:tRNA N6-adenosine(37)-N6-threonylcarbamoyltransferase complex dimerization subunit TsaB n=1 Tax=Methylacidiphilum caldifontis TaxID=2795386 RepID=A0A4Y8PDP9_9BACT|nr:tRNA (adenosine(37)-N6)-threonylcarbamoyltransferase complex dimerization subunit type 1 TsaB [Methylacidiphilum caldifontis]QSR88087.1 tRNA (adenosine(37)-N6)-threonylcarbamoyltransferase complex dimerization subunit type 1 TsaB [Methylacidiphilum caldifontis]TFE69622.1 tRNA N6-adenosine(37)-N6-threonylcarbamoyltransferase complex dimerization subunit TsaB [Methylacidiphilum caldifontis]